jgi:hypothetical protein
MNTASSGKGQEGTTYCGFEVGQHVVLVDDSRFKDNDVILTAIRIGCTLPVKGVVYTVRDVELIRDFVTIRLVEIVNPPDPSPYGSHGEPQWPVIYFRPLPKLRVEDFAVEGVSA